MLPVYIRTDGVALPESGNYYIVAENGYFLHKGNLAFRSIQRVASIPVLEEQTEGVVCFLPKISSMQTHRIKEFFRKVVEQHDTEACVLLYLSRKTGRYNICVPPQRVSKAAVHYQRNLVFKNHNLVGTIHSHCDFQAFHSGVDDRDEENFDGLHMTFGHCDQQDFDISASIVINGRRTKVPPKDFLNGIRSTNNEGYYRLTTVKQTTEDRWYQMVNQSWMSSVSRG